MCQPKDIFLSIEFMVQCHVLYCVPTATIQLYSALIVWSWHCTCIIWITGLNWANINLRVSSLFIVSREYQARLNWAISEEFLEHSIPYYLILQFYGAGQKFTGYYPTKLFNQEFAEIDDITVIRDGDHLFLTESWSWKHIEEINYANGKNSFPL